MPRNGSGQMNLPSGNPVVTGTNITSTWANATMPDIAAEISNSLARDGQAPPTANLPMGGFKLTGLANGTDPQDSAAYGQIVSSADIASSAVGKGSKLIAFIQRLTGAVSRWVEDKLSETVSVLDFGADATGTTASDTAFAAAAATGKSVLVPDGNYLLGTTITLAANQRFHGRRGGANIWKNANVPMFFIPTIGTRSGFQGLSFFGNYIGPGFGSIPGRPAAAASFTDTTDNIQVGVVGVEGPYFWVFDDCESQYAGQHGLNWIDGPSPYIRGYVAYCAGWGFISTQTQVVGGTAIDTHHVTIAHLEATGNGNSTLTDGGGVYLRGGNHTALNIKCFGNYGDGFALNATASKVSAMTEQNGIALSSITTWAAGQTIVIGNFRKYLNNLYVATTAGTTGSTAPIHTTGTASDGGVNWQFRRGADMNVESNGWDCNEVHQLWNDGVYKTAGNTDIILMTQSAAGANIARTNLTAKRMQVSRAPDFQLAGGAGAFELLNLQPQIGGGNAQWEIIGTNGTSTVHDLYLGNAAGNALRLRGAGVGSIVDVPLGAKVLKINSTYSLYGKPMGVADLLLVDATSGVITVTIDPGTDGIAGRRLMIVKTDASANAVTITGSGTYNGTAFGSFTLASRWAFTELFLMDTTGPNWWKKV